MCDPPMSVDAKGTGSQLDVRMAGGLIQGDFPLLTESKRTPLPTSGLQQALRKPARVPGRRPVRAGRIPARPRRDYSSRRISTHTVS